MGLPALHTARMRALLTAMAAEQTRVGRLAYLALSKPSQLTDAQIVALGDAMARCAGPVRTDSKPWEPQN